MQHALFCDGPDGIQWQIYFNNTFPEEDISVPLTVPEWCRLSISSVKYPEILLQLHGKLFASVQWESTVLVLLLFFFSYFLALLSQEGR